VDSACEESGTKRFVFFFRVNLNNLRHYFSFNLAPQTSLTIVSTITSQGAEPLKLDRYRNELAASLLGIKPHKANTEGLLTLRKLAASAPNPNGDVVFLPAPRAVNVVKAIQTWVLVEDGEVEDEEIDEEVESAMLPVFMNLAPILQSLSGSHWPFIFDVLEGVLERASGDAEKEEEEREDAELEEDERVRKELEEGTISVALARALRLLQVIEDMTMLNKSLMGEWKERRTLVMKRLLNLNVLSGVFVCAPMIAR
jgi:hypothetical protein